MPAPVPARVQPELSTLDHYHFAQDYFSHRQMAGYLHDNTWLPFGTLIGHAWIGNGHTPDYVAARPDLADLMVEDSYTYIRSYVKALHNTSEAQAPGEVSSASLNKLIQALAAVYPKHIERTNSGTQTGRIGNDPIVDTVVFDDIPNQTAANQALSSALADIGHFNLLSSDLPSYSYALPYDKPSTPLSEVKAKLMAN